MALEAGGEDLDVTGQQFGDFSLNPSFGLDPSYDPRAIKLVPKQIFPETTSQLIAPLSTTYAPPGTKMASLAPAPGQPTNLVQGADLGPPPLPAVQPVIPPEAIAPPVQVAQAGPGVAAPPVSPRPNVVPATPNLPNTGLTARIPEDPNMDVLQQQYNQKALDLKKARALGYGAINQTLNYSVAKSAREDEARILGEMHELELKIQVQKNNQNMARNYNLWGKVGNAEDAAALSERAIEEARQGNFGAYSALLGSPHAERAKGYTAEVVTALAPDVAKASKLFGPLADAAALNKQRDYDIARKNLLDGAAGIKNRQFFGMTEGNIPKSIDEWKQRGDIIQGPVKSATQFVNNYDRAQKDQMAPQVITDQAAAGAIRRDSTGKDVSTATPVKLPSQGGAVATRYDNSTADPADFRKNGKWTFWDDVEKQTATDLIVKNPVHQGLMNQHQLAVRFNGTVSNDDNFRDAAGATLVFDSLGGVFRDQAEKSQASGNVGLTKQFHNMLGWVEEHIAKGMTNWSAFKTFITEGGPEVKPEFKPGYRIDDQTRIGLQRIGKFNLDEVNKQVPRLKGVAAYVGDKAGDLVDIGISPEMAEQLEPYRAIAEQSRRNKIDSRDRIIQNGRHYELPLEHTIDPNTPGFVKKGSYGASIAGTNNNVVRPPPPVVTAPPPPPAAGAPSAFPTGGAAPVPGFAPPGAVAVPGRRSEAAPSSVGNIVQSALGISPAQAAEAPPVAANLPASWGVTTPQAGALPAIEARPGVPSPTAVSPGGGRPAAPVATPSAAGGGGGTLAPVPSYLRNNPVASTVYTSAGETARNLSGGNVVVGNNVAKIATSSAASESSFKPHELHDRDETTGEYAGYGLFGHQGSRLKDMQKSAGVEPVGKPGGAILPEAQTAFYAREIMQAAKTDPFIAKVLNDPNASAEDLTRVQMRMEKPKGYNGPGTEEKGMNWTQRLAHTQKTMLGSGQQISGAPVGSPGAAKAAEAGYWGSQSRIGRATIENAPAVGATIGGMAGTPWGPVGQAVGAETGGVLGGVTRHAITGEDQSLGGYGKAALGGAWEAVPYAVPGSSYKALAGRAVTSGIVEGGTTYAETGNVRQAAAVGAGAALSAAGSEAFALALGKASSGIYRIATRPNQQMMEDFGKVLSEQKPKTMLADGTTIENKAYTEAKEWAESKNIPPDHLAHAYEEATKLATRKEALLSRPGYVAQKEAGRGLDEVLHGVGATTLSTPALKAQKLVNSIEHPEELVNRGIIPERFRGDAQEAANTMAGVGKPPITNFGQMMDNMAEARTDLLRKEAKAQLIPREAGEAFVQKDKTVGYYQIMQQHVRQQQEKLIRDLLPPGQSQPLIDHLNASGKRYREAIINGGDDVVRAIGQGGGEANRAVASFNKLAGNDEAAKQMVRALSTSANSKVGKVTGLAVAATASQVLHVVPVFGTIAAGTTGVLTVNKIGELLRDFALQKGSGKQVTMDFLLRRELLGQTQEAVRRGAATIGGSAGANAVNTALQPAPATQ